jgi:hypothetical protein
MLSFELRQSDQVDRVLSRFRIIMPALSLGGVESLVCVPRRASHRASTSAERQRAGISDGLVRVSIGIEDEMDLREDLAQALANGRSSPDERRKPTNDMDAMDDEQPVIYSGGNSMADAPRWISEWRAIPESYILK